MANWPTPHSSPGSVRRIAISLWQRCAPTRRASSWTRRCLAFPFRAAYVPAVSPAYPSKKLSRPLLTKDGRRVLELLVGSAQQGCTEAFLLAHGFTVDLLADMVRAGFATAQSERVRAGGQPIDVTRVHITDAGRRALKGKRTQ